MKKNATISVSATKFDLSLTENTKGGGKGLILNIWLDQICDMHEAVEDLEDGGVAGRITT